MPHAIIHVRDAALIWQEEQTQFDESTELPESEVSLVRDSALRGMISYLLGETEKVALLGENHLKAINGLIENGRFELDRAPHHSSAFFRKKTQEDVMVSKVDLSRFSFEEAYPLVQQLRPFLLSITKQDTLGGVYQHFVDSQKNCKITDGSLPDVSFIPESKQKEKILKTISHKNSHFESFFNLVEAINQECRTNPIFSNSLVGLNSLKWSLFKDLGSNRHWLLNDSLVPRSFGAPVNLVMFSFRLLLENLDEVVFERFRGGPGVARFGEGGVVDLELFEGPYLGQFSRDRPNLKISRKFIRQNLLPKLKKLDWEKSLDEKSKVPGKQSKAET